MFPLRDDNPIQRIPFVTVILIAVNVVVFIYEFIQPDQGQRVVMQFGFIPIELTHGAELTPYAHFPTIGTVFTSMFMHGGWLHLIGNMLYLWIFGDNCEDLLGPFWFIVFYLLSGIGAVLLFVVFSPNANVPLVGASGAISGVLGLYALKFPRARDSHRFDAGVFHSHDLGARHGGSGNLVSDAATLCAELDGERSLRRCGLHGACRRISGWFARRDNRPATRAKLVTECNQEDRQDCLSS